MKLFTITDKYDIELNKEWIYMIPQFAALLKRDKGSPGDYRGQFKLKARKEFKFIYFDLDFASPLRDYPEYERRQEALKYAELKESDIDDVLMEAHATYDQLLNNATRSLRTLRAVKKSLDALDTYFEELDFTKVDKKGELVHSPDAYLRNLERLDKAYSSVEKFEKRVQDELKANTSIRGTATLGEMEGKRTEWNEGGSAHSVDEETGEVLEPIAPVNMAELGSIIGKALKSTDDKDL